MRCFNCGDTFPEERMRPGVARVDSRDRKVPYCEKCFHFFRSPAAYVTVAVGVVVFFARSVWSYKIAGRGPVIFGVVVFLIALTLILWHLAVVKSGPYYVTYSPRKRW